MTRAWQVIIITNNTTHSWQETTFSGNEETQMKAKQESTLPLLEIALGMKRNTVAGDELATFPLELGSTQLLMLAFSY